MSPLRALFLLRSKKRRKGRKRGKGRKYQKRVL
jgi:hypothetical protein